MAYDLVQPESRLALIKFIESPENKARKAQSFREYEIFNERQRQYVVEYLRGQFSQDTVREMPIIDAIHLCTRIVKEKASLYGTEPTREFMGVTDELKAQIEKLFKNIKLNKKMQSLNRYFKLQRQAHLNWTIINGELRPRVLLKHHLDVIPQDNDPESGMIYVISSFDKSEVVVEENQTPTGVRGRGSRNQDVKARIKRLDQRYHVWTQEYNFTMNGNGEIIPDADGEYHVENPISPLVPFIEVTDEKDFEYWIPKGSAAADFSVQFNGMASDLQNVVKMQGWGQAVFVGPENSIPKHFVIGMNSVIRLPTDPTTKVNPEFKYVSASPDIDGSLKTLVFALSAFLSSEGLDPATINTSGSAQGYTSALDRLLAMIQEFEASKDDMDIFQAAELKSFEIVKAFINVYGGTEILNSEVKAIPETASMSIIFSEPTMIKSEKEQLDITKQRREMGLQSRVSAYMETWGVDEPTALKEIAKIDGEKAAPPADGAPADENDLEVNADEKIQAEIV